MTNMTEQQRLEEVIKRMKRVQKEISADHQPASAFQIRELMALGQTYAEIVENLKGQNKKI